MVSLQSSGFRQMFQGSGCYDAMAFAKASVATRIRRCPPLGLVMFKLSQEVAKIILPLLAVLLGVVFPFGESLQVP